MRRRWIAGLIAGTFLLAASLGFADSSPVAVSSDADIKRAVTQLGSEDFVLREQATRELIKFGAPVCAALEPLIQSDDPELRARVFLVLQQLYSGKDLAAVDSAQQVLESLRQETVPPHIRQRAETILVTFEKGLEERAVQRLLDNGAVLFPTETTMINGLGPSMIARREGLTEYSLFLGKNWKGANDKLLLDLRRIRWRFLYYSKLAKIDVAALQIFPRNNPNLKVEPRGEAKLGISSPDDSDRLPPPGDPNRAQPIPRIILSRVEPGSSAEEAGLKIGEEILSFEGREASKILKPFPALIELIATKNVGDKISLQVRGQDGQERAVTIVLKGWTTRLK